MAVGWSDTLRKNSLMWMTGETVVPGHWWFALCNAVDGTAEPTITASGYGRKQLDPNSTSNWNAAINGASTSNKLDITFGPSAGANAAWGALAYGAIYDAVTAGNLLAVFALSPSVNVTGAGQTVKFVGGAPGGMVISLT